MTQGTPLDAAGAATEYAAVRSGAGVVDRSDAGVVEVTGRDRATFLHAMLSNDVKSLQPGQGCTAALLDVHGKVQTFLTVWALDDRMLMLTPPGLAAKTVESLDTFLFSEKAYLRDASGEFGLLLVAGPETTAMIERIAHVALPEQPWNHAAAQLVDGDVRIVRGSGESGETEAWIACSSGEVENVRKAVRAAGALPVGEAAWESLRIETGTPLFGADVDPGVLLPEVPFEDRVSYSKGCYLGQEVVVRIRDRGHVNRTLRGLVLDGQSPPARDDRVLAGADEVGRVTSATWSYGLGRPIALAFVRRQHAEPGTVLAVAVAGGERLPATVSALPFTR